MKMIITTTSPDKTKLLAKKISDFIKTPVIILLNGDLGVGKSEFVRGFAKAIGIQTILPSPSFNILNAYEDGEPKLYHFDLYRINDEDELFEIGFWDYIKSDGISLVEWPYKSENLVNNYQCLLINIEYGLHENERLFKIENINGYMDNTFMRELYEHISV